MNWWHPPVFEAKRPYLQARMAVIKAIRGYFEGQDLWEVETPALQSSPTMDTHIHAFKTELLNQNLAAEKTIYLHTSPEFAMKKLLVAGAGDMFQLCHAYRNAEISKLHSPEFTLLEWYRKGAEAYEAVMQDCEALIRKCASAAGVDVLRRKNRQAYIDKDFTRLTVAEAFQQYAEIDLAACLEDNALFVAKANAAGIRTARDDRWDDIFFRIMAEKIEPFLGDGVPCILHEYPLSMAALARREPRDERFARRFEIYACGVELANGFDELTDTAEQRTRFHAEMAAKKEIYGLEYPVDEDFLKAIEHGLPPCAGVAMGVDRLVMLLTGAEDIGQVLWAGRAW